MDAASGIGESKRAWLRSALGVELPPVQSQSADLALLRAGVAVSRYAVPTGGLP